MSCLGFIGLGIMGKPMCKRLLEAGHTVNVYDVATGSVQEVVKKGGVACNSCKEVAEKSEIIFIMVPDTPDVEAVLFGESGLTDAITSGSTVVDMSSISPIATKDFAKRLESAGVQMLDAPVSGGEVAAKNGTLSIMVGGKPQTLNRVKPYLEIMGKNIVHIGENGDGQICKVANQIVVGLTIEAVGEALLFASKAGADPSRVREALLGGFAQSRILDLHGRRMIMRTFDPGFRIRHQQKDLNLALQAASILGISLPNTATTQQLYNSVAIDGGENLDHSALVLALEKLAGYSVASKEGV